MLFIGASLGSKGSTLDFMVTNHIFSTISGDIPVSRSLVWLLGSDQLWSNNGSRQSFPTHYSKKIPRSCTVISILWILSTPELVHLLKGIWGNKNCGKANHWIHSQYLLQVLQRPPFWILKTTDLTHNLTHDSLTHVYRTLKKRAFWLMKGKLRAVVSWFPNDMTGQRVAHITQLTSYFEKYYVLRICHFIHPFLFHPCVVEMIVLP